MNEDYVRLVLGDTGEVFEWKWGGEEHGEPWEQSALDIALLMVPHVMDALDRAHIKGADAEVHVAHISGVQA